MSEHSAELDHIEQCSCPPPYAECEHPPCDCAGCLVAAHPRGIPSGPAAIHFGPMPGCLDLWESEATCEHAALIPSESDAITQAHEKGFEAGYAQACEDFGRTSVAIAIETLCQAQAEWSSQYDETTRTHPKSVKVRAALRMAAVLAGERADAITPPGLPTPGAPQ